MITKVLKTIEDYGMLYPGCKVVAGVSGGADSMALLDILAKQQEPLVFRLLAAHVNHGLRGAEADRDEESVRAFCQKKGIPLEILRVDLLAEAQKRKLGLEACGREIRYAYFRELAGEDGKIATGHTLSDLAETVLLHVARGTGIQGLAGMQAVRGNIIRPLIGCSRQETEDYCRRQEIPFVTDSTNLQDIYARNKIRLKAVPVFKEINPGWEQAAARLSRSAAEDDAYLYDRARLLLENARQSGGFSCKSLQQEGKPVRIRAVRLLLENASPEAKHLEEIDGLIQEGRGGVSVPGGWDVCVKRGLLMVLPHKKRRIPQ